MLKLFRYLKPYLLSVIALIFSVAAQVWCTLQLPALMANIINDGIVTGDSASTLSIGLRMLAYTLLNIVFAVSSHYFSAKVGAAFSRDLRDDFYKKVLSFSVADIDKFTTASLITRTTNDISQVQNAIMMVLTMLLRAPMMGVGALVQAFRTAPDMTWILALSLASVLVLSATILALVIPKFKIYQKLTDRLTLLARENLTGLRVIRSFNNEKHEQKKFEKSNDDLTNVNLYINKLMSLQDPLINLIFNGTTLLIVWVGISHYEIDPAYIGNTIAFTQYATQVIMSFLILTMLFVVLPRANVSASRINEVLANKNKIVWKEKTNGTPETTPSVEFKNVSFAYPGAAQNVLSNISFAARAGETTAFIGSTGSGKSTLISLIPRFHEASSGEILVNNLNIKDYAESDLMQKIGYIPQRGRLFSGTVKSNLSFGAPSTPLAALRHAASVSQSLNFIDKLDDKFNARISQGGSNVSGGQKQRLSIARAIAKRPEIYIFDDSFSALDMKTDKKLREALKPETKDSVVLVVAQRISTIKDADQIVVLEDGKIKGIGQHRSLLKTCELYRNIVRSQLSDQEYERELKNA